MVYAPSVASLVGIYCSQGPYRHVRGLLERGADWLPWGYRTASIAPNIELHPGDLVELWEADDTRDPHHVVPVAVATVDFISRSEGYVAFTLRPRADAECSLGADAVLEVARERRLLAALPVPVRSAI
jgi:hypothetical protein